MVLLPCFAAAYNGVMRSSSLPLGRIFGVELRLHVYSIAALVLLMVYTSLDSLQLRRGFFLWLLLGLAIAVRELGRALAAAAMGMDLRRLVLLPTGGTPTYAGESIAKPRNERLLALTGPISNFVAALTMALLVFSVTSQVNLFQRQVIGPANLLRAAIWLQVLIGGLHLMPVSPMDAGTLLRREFVRVRGAARGARAAAVIGQVTGWLLVLIGALSQEIVLMLMGGTVLLTAQAEGHTSLAQEAAKALTMRDVMLTEWTSLAASDTLEEALRRSTHSLQEIFPVVRGPLIVGAVGRQSLLFNLRSNGNSYVQGAMSRNVQIAAPGDPLVETLQRATAATGGRAMVMPIVEGERVVGLVTPQNLSHAMSALGQTQRLLHRRREGSRKARPDD